MKETLGELTFVTLITDTIIDMYEPLKEFFKLQKVAHSKFLASSLTLRTFH
jgi:hypothetical protein